MWNAGLFEAQAGKKIASRNIKNLRCANDTTLRAESEEELKGLLMKVKEESEKAGLKLNIQCRPMAVSFQCMTKFTTNKEKKKKLNIQKTKIMASSPITSW